MDNNEDINAVCRFCNSKSSCFHTLSKEDLDEVSLHRSEINFRKGEVIVKQGDFVNNVYYIRSGMAKVYQENEQKNIILNIMPQGFYIGLPFLYGTTTYKYTATAIIDSVICSIDIKAFRNLVVKNAMFAERLIQLLNECSLQNFERFVSHTQKQTNGRLADSLLYLSEKIYNSTAFKLDLSRRDLAELASMSTMSAVHILKDFKDNGIISDVNGHIEILDMEMLRRISRIG